MKQQLILSLLFFSAFLGASEPRSGYDLAKGRGADRRKYQSKDKKKQRAQAERDKRKQEQQQQKTTKGPQ